MNFYDIEIELDHTNPFHPMDQWIKINWCII
jgi:hypothetical protein